jgi:hypothetical protein
VASSTVLVVGAVLGLFGLGISAQARKPYSRRMTITEIMSAPEGVQEPGETTILRGPVEVTDPAKPERPPPEEVAEKVTSPALWAWRVRHQEKGGRSTHWETIESGLEIGDFTVQQDWDHVRVDSNWLADEIENTSTQTSDPFEMANLYLGEPESDVPLGELNPLNKLLERLGLTGDGGIITNAEAQVSFGGETTSPDRYQSTIIQDGDELLLRGELTETADGLVLQGTDETPLVIATGDLEQKAQRLRSKALQQGGFGLLLVLLAVATVATGTI